MSMQEFYCFSCGTQNQVVAWWDVVRNVPNVEPMCMFAKLRFYDPNQYNECRETSADVVREKDRPITVTFSIKFRKARLRAKKKDLLSAAEALFKNRLKMKVSK